MVSDTGAPTGKWPTLPPHLTEPTSAAPAGGAKLTVRRPGVPEVEIPLERDELTIGRKATDVDLALDDELVSKKHARLTVDARGYFKLQDLGSTNGISFAGRTVRRLNLIDGDEFSIGKTDFVFHAEMRRFEGIEPLTKPPPSPRSESVFGEVDVPIPKNDASVLASADDIGWDPAAARGGRASGPEVTPQSPAVDEEDQDEEDEDA